MAIEMDVQPKDKNIAPAAIFFAAAVIIFIAFIATFLFFQFSTKKMSDDIQAKSNALVKTEEEKALENRMALLSSKVENFKTLLSSHKKVINIFAKLEENNHPDVWLTSFKFNTDEVKTEVAGFAKNFLAFFQQIEVWQKTPNLKEITLSSFQTGEGGIKFEVLFAFEASILE